ncbi:MAG: manganese efflux pump MntP family protein [Alphaproteobacteria bacterium]|nr:manganese efflux pump MntP family protein [Alphaproteobacteria bacterium]
MGADSFAAAVAKGVAQRPNKTDAVLAGLVFGLTEGTALVIGWALGVAANAYITAIDHWIAFVLLTAIGLRMISSARRQQADPGPVAVSAWQGPVAIAVTAIGTSIDAAAIGVSLAFLDTDIIVAALVIAAATFGMATTGLLLGRVVGTRRGALIEIVAGGGLILLGCKILADHLGIFA